MRLISYFHRPDHIMWYKLLNGGGVLIRKLYDEHCQKLALAKQESQRNDFLKRVEQARQDWQFSLKLLAETTDADLVDYVIYLVKANEAKYRYLTKLARKEKLTCQLWQN